MFLVVLTVTCCIAIVMTTLSAVYLMIGYAAPVAVTFWVSTLAVVYVYNRILLTN